MILDWWPARAITWFIHRLATRKIVFRPLSANILKIGNLETYSFCLDFYGEYIHYDSQTPEMSDFSKVNAILLLSKLL